MQAQECSNLFISEYVEGWSNNKAIELYNPTNETIDLSNYALSRWSNGGQIPETTVLEGSIAPKESFVVGIDKRDPDGESFDAPLWDGWYYYTDSTTSLPDSIYTADEDLMGKVDLFICPDYNTGPTTMYFNGNDAVTLETASGDILDIIGKIGEDPGDGWTDASGKIWTKDKTLIRKASVTSGFVYDPTQPYTFDPSIEWDSLPANTFSNLGYHYSDCIDSVETGACIYDDNNNGICDETEYYGCTDLNACNYNFISVENNGSCIYPGELAFVELLNNTFSQGTNLFTQGTNLFTQGSNLFTQGTHLFTQGTELFVQGSSLFFQGTNIFTQGTQLVYNGITSYLNLIIDQIYDLFLTFDTEAEAAFDCNGCLNDINENGVCDEFEEDCLPPSSWNYQLTESNMTIFIPNTCEIILNETPTENNILIGAFYTDSNGDHKCAGYTLFNGDDTHISIMGDDTTTEIVDGFSPNEPIIWKIWNTNTCEEYQGYATINSGTELYETNAVEVLISLNTITCQDVFLPGGWFMLSSYIDINDLNIQNVFSTLDENLIIVKNNLGSVFLPEFNFNGIGNYNITEGYQIKTNLPQSMSFCRKQIKPEDVDILMTSGWNIIPYLRENPALATQVLIDLTDNENLIIVKDYLGNPYLPEFNYNGLGEMKAGQAYQLKIQEPQIFNYIANENQYFQQNETVISNYLSHYKYTKPTGNNMHIIIPDNAWDKSLPMGTEIVAYNSFGIQVGSMSYNKPISVLTIWGDDITTPTYDGLQINEQVELKIWNEQDLVRNIQIVSWKQGSGRYEYDAINVVEEVIINEEKEVSFVYEPIPNPADLHSNIYFYLKEPSQVNISIFDVYGKKMIEVTDSYYYDGMHSIRNDISMLNIGTYFYAIETRDHKETKKFVIMR